MQWIVYALIWESKGTKKGERGMNPTADKVKEIIEKSNNVVVLSGINVIREIGLNGVRAEHIAYEIEEEYGYSNEEIASSAFFARRGPIFYDYIKKIALNVDDPQPTVVHKSIRQLQQRGKVKHIITRTVYEMYEKAGCEGVIDMHGSLEKNKCPVCGKIFGMKYLKQAKSTPQCDVCQIPLRPGVTLIGEQVDNGKVTDACNYAEQADVLLAIGASVRDPMCEYLERYYTGDKLVLINTEEKHGDERANYRLYGNISEIVSYVTGYQPKAVFPDTSSKPTPKKAKGTSKTAKGSCKS
jgi:NAD-dependent deacetylase